MRGWGSGDSIGSVEEGGNVVGGTAFDREGEHFGMDASVHEFTNRQPSHEDEGRHTACYCTL